MFLLLRVTQMQKNGFIFTKHYIFQVFDTFFNLKFAYLSAEYLKYFLLCTELCTNNFLEF